MGSILQTLKAVAVQRPTKLTSAMRRRNKLIDSLHQQIEAAKARSEGKLRIPTIVTGCTDDRDRWVSADAWCSNSTPVGHDDAAQGCP